MDAFGLSFSRIARYAPSFRTKIASKISKFYVFINCCELLSDIFIHSYSSSKNRNEAIRNMRKRIKYIFNPETNDFEREFPTIGERLLKGVLITGAIVACGALLAILYLYSFDSPTEKELRKENRQLRSQYNILNRRLDNSLKVMEDIRNRDDNFYRVMLQMEPMSFGQRFAGADNDRKYRQIRKMADSELVGLLTRKMDLFDRQIYAQSLSFDELKEEVGTQKDKLRHIPSILPISISDYSMSSGYGYRRDPIYGTGKFHEGLDFAAPIGTQVFATADGTVEEASRHSGYGNCIDISHGYNYMTRYAHLSEILVKPGQEVKRGELIGLVGSTGKSIGPHLHYEVRYKDEPQNPVNYYFMDISPEEYSEMIRMADNAGYVMD